MELTDRLKKLNKKLSRRDWKTLLIIYDECKKLGATSEQLAPLGALIFIDWSWKPNAKTIEAIIDTELERNLTKYNSVKKMMEDSKNW